MRLFLLDTSSKILSLAVADEQKILSQMHKPMDRKHSTQLICLIERLLKQAHAPLKKIDAFCVSQGPGSFTGLRIGITTVKALALIWNKPVIAIPSLDILAQNASKIKSALARQICPIVDARQNKIYACLYQGENGNIKRKSQYLLLPVKELVHKLKGEILFLGDAVSVYREKICAQKKIKPIFAGQRFWYPRAESILVLARKRWARLKFDDANSLTPLYLYPKECQIKQR